MVTNVSGNVARKFSGGSRALDTLLFGSYEKPKERRDQRKAQEHAKILKKYNTLDDMYPTFTNFMEDPMALSFFRSYLYAKVCIEIESTQSEKENVQLTYKVSSGCIVLLKSSLTILHIYEEFFKSGPSSGAPTLNIDGSLLREVAEAVNNVSKACTSAVFKNALDLVVHQMQSEWFYFKKSQQGQTLLDNLNSNTFVILPAPTARPSVTLPSDWSPSDDPINWGLGTSSHTVQVCVGE